MAFNLPRFSDWIDKFPVDFWYLGDHVHPANDFAWWKWQQVCCALVTLIIYPLGCLEYFLFGCWCKNDKLGGDFFTVSILIKYTSIIKMDTCHSYLLVLMDTSRAFWLRYWLQKGVLIFSIRRRWVWHFLLFADQEVKCDAPQISERLSLFVDELIFPLL